MTDNTATTDVPAAPATDPHADAWAALAAPFPLDWIEKLPKPVKRNDDNRGRCEAGSYYSADGHACGGYHSRSVHLDYVGHAGITMRLNAVVGPGGWTLEPLATTDDGVPAVPRSGEFWCRLTVLGVSKVDLAANYSSTQEAWGDALRRCAMRFGIGTYLWAKSEYAAELASHQPDPSETPEGRAAAAIAQLASRDDWTVEALAAGEEHAAANGYLTEDLSAAIMAAATAARERAQQAQQADPEPEAQQAPAEAPSAPPAAQQPAPGPGAQQTELEAAYDVAREALNSGDADLLRALYRSSPDLIRTDVLAVLGDDDLAALAAPQDLADLPLGTLLIQLAGYVEKHGAAVRDLGQPATQATGPDPWAEDQQQPEAFTDATGWPPVAGQTQD